MLTKTVYCYDKVTNEYIGETIAHESPRRPETYLTPPYTTEIVPPDTREYEVAVFDTVANAWSIQADCRGKTYYNTETKERHVIRAIGVLPDAGWTNLEPIDTEQVWTGSAWEIPFAILKERKTAEIRAISAVKIVSIEDGYSLGEIKTFEQQYAGAIEILAGGVAEDITAMSKDAQFVINLANGRSAIGGVEVSPEELAEKIKNNYTTAKEITVTVLSIQQGLETRVRLAASREEIEAIQWPETV